MNKMSLNERLFRTILAAACAALLGLTTYQLLPETITVSGENGTAGMAGTSGTSSVSSQTTTAASDNDAVTASAGDTAMLGIDPVGVSGASTTSGIINTGNGGTATDTGDAGPAGLRVRHPHVKNFDSSDPCRAR